MSTVDETKEWILIEVWPEIIKSGKLCKNSECPNLSNADHEKSFKLIDMCVTPIGLEEAFMLTTCFRIQIDYTSSEDSSAEKKSLNLISKKTPTTVTKESFEVMNFATLFHNEILAYKTIIPKLLQLANREDYKNNLPKYYYSNFTASEASIVLGDFKEQGFRMAPTRVNLSLEHILLGAEHIGFFHGLCYAFKFANRKEFDEIVSLTREARYAKELPPKFTKMGIATISKLKKAAEKFYPEMPKDFQDNLVKLLTNLFPYSKKMVQPVQPFATLNHGDYLRNNIAFAYDDMENPTVPKKAMMFDFQTLRYSSPMVDLTTFLTISAGTDVRTKHFDEIFDTYLKALTSTFTEISKLPVPDFMSRSSMLKEYARLLAYSIGVATYFLPQMHEQTTLFTDFLAGDDDVEKFKRAFLSLGGDVADRELASLQRELYEFSVKENINYFED